MKRAIIVTDLGLGDQGKGTTVDFLTRQHDVSAIIRTNGGAQALHHIVTPDGIVHGFSQFGSGTLMSNPPLTIHGPMMLCSPEHLLYESEQLAALGVSTPLSRVVIDKRAIISTPWHRAGNWLREIARGDGHHGTCGFGIGETMQDLLDGAPMLHADDLLDAMRTSRIVAEIRRYKIEQYQHLIEQLCTYSSPAAQQAIKVLDSKQTLWDFLQSCATLRRSVRILSTAQIAHELSELSGTVLFEGAQGVLLDEWYGFHPHTTWSTTTSKNPLQYLSDLEFNGSIERLGLLRAYASRHGAGPLMTYDPELTKQLPEAFNREDGWAGEFRCGWFDAITGRYSLRATGGVDGLVLTCLDRVADMPTVKYAVAYKYRGVADLDELCQYFDFDGERIVDIRLPECEDLTRQARLTELLQECTPLYAEVPPSKLVSAIAAELCVRVQIVSQGPTSADKHYVT
jgi:adenylosuccinate synthase